MPEIVRYRVDPAVRWLEAGAQAMRSEAKAQGRDAAGSVGADAESVKRTFRKAAGSVRDFGRGAAAGIAHRRAESVEYVLDADRLDIVHGGAIETIPYSEMQAVELKGERATIRTKGKSAVIKPVAHLVTAGARVPLGWSRNGLDAPYLTLVEEIAARAGLAVLKS